MKKPVTEGIEEHAAFEFYLALGSSRTVKQVAKKFGKKPAVVDSWRAMFEWDTRVMQRERVVKRKLEAETDRSMLDVARAYRSHLSLLIETYMDNPSGIKDVGELLRAMKTDTELAKLTDEPETDTGGLRDMSPEQLREFIRKKREARSEHDTITVRRFRGLERGGADGACADGGGDRPPPSAQEGSSLRSAPEAIPIPHIYGAQESPKWRKQVPSPDDEVTPMEWVRKRASGGSGG